MPPRTVTSLIVLAAIAAMAALILARRFATGTSDRRSVERYERSLDHLGGVTRRTDAIDDRTTTDGEIAPVHLGPLSHSMPAAAPLVAPTRPVAPPPAAALLPDTTLIFGDDDLVPRPRESAEAHSRDRGTDRAKRSAVSRPSTRRRLSARFALAVAFVAIAVVGGTALFGNGSKPHSSTAASAGSHGTRGVTSHTVTTPTVAPEVYSPANISPGLVSYGVPNRAHTLSFACTGACWAGVESSTSGPYLWMDTIASGSKATYSTSKNVVVRIGAPSASSMTVDGVPVAFPKQQVGAFDVVLTESAKSTSRR